MVLVKSCLLVCSTLDSPLLPLKGDIMDPSGGASWRPQQSALDDAAGEALRNQQEANMVFGAFAAASSGLVPDANTNWDYGAGGLPLSELSCGKLVPCRRRLLLYCSNATEKAGSSVLTETPA